MEKIQIRIGKIRTAFEINSAYSGREFIIDEIELGTGKNCKAIKYTRGFLKENSECHAVIIGEGKVKIINNL